MNRNTQERFALNPTNIDIQRSRFLMTPEVKTSFNVGDLVPIGMPIEVLPGDTFEIDTAFAVRMQPLVSSPMDNLSFDYYWFFVPNRLVWNHWKEFMGENTESAWIPETEYTIPQITAPENGWNIGTIADYFGIPTGISGLSVSALPFRAYALICNEWFRDENLTDPLYIPVDDANVVGVNTGSYITDTAKGGLPFIAAKYHDLFTSALPAPQKGPDVTIPIGTFAPVNTLSESHGFTVTQPIIFNKPDSWQSPSVHNAVFGVDSTGINKLLADSSSQSAVNGNVMVPLLSLIHI